MKSWPDIRSTKRDRDLFREQADAQNYTEEQRIRIENSGRQGASILPPAHQEQDTFALPQPSGVSLNELVQDWISRRNARMPLDPLRERDGCLCGVAQAQPELRAQHSTDAIPANAPSRQASQHDYPGGSHPGNGRYATIGPQLHAAHLGRAVQFQCQNRVLRCNPVKRVDLYQRGPPEIQIHTGSDAHSGGR